MEEFTDWTGPDHVALFQHVTGWLVMTVFGSGCEKPSLRWYSGESEARHAYRLTVEHWQDITGVGG